MSQIVSSNSFHYFKNQFFQEEVPIPEKVKCYDVGLWKKAGIKYSAFREILINKQLIYNNPAFYFKKNK